MDREGTVDRGGLDAWTPKGAKKPHVMDAGKLPLRVESMALPVPAQ